MTDTRLRDNLRLLGLSAKEIAVYLTILDHGKATVSQVVDDADVSQRHVYQMCERLDERGLVVLNDHVRPSVVRAQAADSAVGNIDSRLDELQTDIANELDGQDVSDLDVELVKSGPTVGKRWRRYIRDATEELFICVPAAVFDQFSAALADAVDRDVTVYLLITGPGLETFDSPIDGHATVARTLDAEPRPLLTIDGERVVLDDPRLLVDGAADGSAISLKRSAVAANLLSTYLSNFWALATEASRCVPDPLPKTYPTLRSAAVHATLHEQAGHDLTATITVRETASDEIIELNQVPIVEIRQGLLDPFTNEFPIENSIRVEYDGSVIAVGGAYSVIEPYEALDIRLERAQ